MAALTGLTTTTTTTTTLSRGNTNGGNLGGDTTFIGRTVRWLTTSSVPRFGLALSAGAVGIASFIYTAQFVYNCVIVFFIKFPSDMPVTQQRFWIKAVVIVYGMLAVTSLTCTVMSMLFASQKFNEGKDIYYGNAQAN